VVELPPKEYSGKECEIYKKQGIKIHSSRCWKNTKHYCHSFSAENNYKIAINLGCYQGSFLQYHFHSSNSDSFEREQDLIGLCTGTFKKGYRTHGKAIWVVL